MDGFEIIYIKIKDENNWDFTLTTLMVARLLILGICKALKWKYRNVSLNIKTIGAYLQILENLRYIYKNSLTKKTILTIRLEALKFNSFLSLFVFFMKLNLMISIIKINVKLK